MMTVSGISGGGVENLNLVDSQKALEEEPPPSITLESPQEEDKKEDSQERESREISAELVYNGDISVEEYVRDYFSDIPIMIDVARCESTFRHFDRNGEVLRGTVNRGDIGVMQINKYYHLETAVRFGIDIYDLDGNLDYARNLYERKGTRPWVHSSGCWRG